MERLWAPWRGEYVRSASSASDEECLFCDLQKRDDEEAYVLARGKRGFVVLNAYPYNSGHLMVAPYRHEGDPARLDDDDSLELQRLLGRALDALREAMSPDGFNVGMNLGRVAGAGVPDHLHWHVVPRWNGDTNYMPIVGETKVMPESLEETYGKLRPILSRDA